MTLTVPNNLLICLSILTLAACSPLTGTGPGESNAVPPAETAAFATPASTASPIPPTTTPTDPPPSPTVVETPPPTTLFHHDLPIQRRAMLPQFADDVELVAQTGASRYHLDISLDMPDDDSGQVPVLSGIVNIRYTNTEQEPLSEIYFRLYPNLPSYGGEMTVQMMQVDDVPVEPTLASENTALRVPLATPLQPNDSLALTLTYQTTIPRQPREGYNVFSYTDGTLALAGLYPAIAVYDDEGWNIEIPPPYGDATYLDISLYQVELTVPDSLVVAASGSTLETTDNDDGTKTLSIVSGPMRDFYLAMRNDYQSVSEMVDGTLVNSYYPPDLEAGGMLALRYAADALGVFNERFGQYPYAELDVVATPTRAGGVEYPGIIVVTQSIYNQPGGFFQHATGHEVAHQWWYGLVGNDQVDEPWLDESLTNYSTVLYWEEIEGEETAERIIDGFFVAPYESAQERGTDRPVIGPVADFSAEEYGLFVYGKGPLFFDALRREVGDEVYFEIMQTYYTEYKYQIARPEDLLAVIDRVADIEIELLVDRWLRGE